MVCTTPALGAFPSPFSIETPPGCEGWQEMYPYYALFDERRREEDENRFWFWNSMHFPVPYPAFDVISIDGPYQAVGSWQNRVFAVPPAMGIDYRLVNGYGYISGNPVTDPAKIAERAEFFQARAGFYFEHWPELYGRWRERMQALIGELMALKVPQLPEYEDDEVAYGTDRNVSFYEVLNAYNRTLRLADLMWQHHFELLLLGYGAYSTFAEFCKAQIPDIPDQHIAQMVAGIDVILFRPDAELRRLARLAVDTGVDGAFVDGRTPAEIDASLSETEAGRAWLAELEAIKEPWFNMATGDGLYHYYRNWKDDPTIPYASLVGHVAAIREGRDVERPTEQIERERERLSGEYRALLDEAARSPFDDLLQLSRMVFPYVEEHKFYCDYWFLTNWWNKVREFGALLTRHGFIEDAEDIFHLKRHEVAEALDELTLTWATGGLALGPRHWPAIVARRKEIVERLGQWSPPPALGVVPEAITDPMTIMLWGVTTQRVREWANQVDGGLVLSGTAASQGVAEGRARVIRSADQIRDVLDGEILVCGSTSPAWAPIFPKIRATVTDIGGVMSHAAIVCREYGLPAVVGTGRATTAIRTGDLIRVDGGTGSVSVLEAGGRCVSPTREYTRALSQLRSDDEPRYGGKSAALGELLEAGLRAPPGFGLSREAYEAARMAGGDRLAVPADVRDQIAARYGDLERSTGRAQPPVAVRSSAVGEDSATATFAGQQETILWVRGLDAVCEAVSECWRSLYSDTAIEYREHLGDGREPAMGVTIQLMVDSLISGVLFTCNPLSGDPSMVAINASWGLGLSVVGGEVTPDDYLVSKVTREVVRETIGDKRIEYIPDPDRSGIVLQEVPGERAAARCLGDREIAALVELATAAQAHFGAHQDIEWAVARTGSPPHNVFVVQSRPVTVIHEHRPAPAQSAISMVMARFGAGATGKS